MNSDADFADIRIHVEEQLVCDDEDLGFLFSEERLSVDKICSERKVKGEMNNFTGFEFASRAASHR